MDSPRRDEFPNTTSPPANTLATSTIQAKVVAKRRPGMLD
jgi:hypothetical protein